MAHDQAQSTLFPQANSASTSQLDNQFARSMQPLALPLDNRFSFHIPRPVFAACDSPIESREVDYKIVSLDDLLQMFPEPKPTRVEVGVLENGMAFAPVGREQYLLFPSKSNFILYFTHYYFSRENLSKDQTFLSKMTNGYMPLATLVQAPRLRAISATQDEVAQALAYSKIVCVEDMGGGVSGVCRRDRAIGAHQLSPSEPWSQFYTEGSFNQADGGLYPGARPYAQPIASASLPNQELTEQPASSTLGDAAKAVVSNTTISQHEQGSVTNPSDVVHVSSASVVPDMNPGLANPPSSAMSSTSVLDYTNNLVASNVPHNGRSGVPTWSTQHSTITSVGPLFCPPTLSQPSLMVDPSSLMLGSHYPLTQNSSSGASASNLHSPYDVPLVPLRQPAAFAPCVLNSGTTYVFGGYPTTSAPNITMAAAAAAIPNQQPHLVTNATFNGAFFGGSAAHLAQFGPGTPAALAAYAAAQQQQQAYFQSPFTHAPQSLQPNVVNASQPGLPFYYANQTFHIPAQISRHRFAHMPVYPLPNYPYQTTVLQNSSHIPVDHANNLNKTEPNGSVTSGGANAAANNAYPMMIPSHMPVHPTNTIPYNLNPMDARLAMAATGLTIHRSFPSVKHPAHVGSALFNVQPHTRDVSGTPSLPTTSKADVVNPDPGKAVSPTKTHFDVENSQKLQEEREPDNSLLLSFTEKVKLSEAPPSGVLVATPADKQQPQSSVDSEDSTSSGIGEMTSACSSSAGDARTLSSFTLTDRVVRSTIPSPKTRKETLHGGDDLKDAV